LAFDDENLEAVHDYIQWLFPLPEKSAFNPFAPILSSQDIEIIKHSVTAQQNLKVAARRLLTFYERNTHWLTAINHNHLRISRIIRSLGLMLGPDEATKFHMEIIRIVQAAGNQVAEQSLDYWRKAAQSVVSEARS
jgi:hypothetical protein